MSLDFSLSAVQQALRDAQCDAWCMYDFRGTNPLARSTLGLQNQPAGSRRWFYLLPAEGTPVKLVHAIETGALDSLPGTQVVYRSWRALHEALRDFLSKTPRVAMEYSPLANNPYVSRIDGGTLELVRQLGVEIVSSGDLIQQFESCLSEEQWQLHLQADRVTTSAFEMAWQFIGKTIREQGRVSEQAVCDRIMQHFKAHQMQTYHAPTVARAPHNRLPHYETGTGSDTDIREGDLVLIDLWCKAQVPSAIYSDLTRMAFVGNAVPARYAEVFQIVAEARDAGIEFVQQRFQSGEKLLGWEVDHVVRQVIERQGFGDSFLHRTGHSLGSEVHGNGAHLDDLEMHEERQILPNSLFTIEPGIYLKDFGIRSEIDVFVDAESKVHITGGPVQHAIELIPVD